MSNESEDALRKSEAGVPKDSDHIAYLVEIEFETLRYTCENIRLSAYWEDLAPSDFDWDRQAAGSFRENMEQTLSSTPQDNKSPVKVMITGRMLDMFNYELGPSSWVHVCFNLLKGNLKERYKIQEMII